jgi:hypothetical protein
MKVAFAFVLALSASALAVASDGSIRGDILAVFDELRTLQPMDQAKTYTLPAQGQPLTGRNDDFLRRRTADEVAASKLSCGCGDYAAVFAERMQARGYDTILIDSAQISLHSLASKFDGHVVVAVRPHDAPTAPWWLVDLTALNIISSHWSSNEKSFSNSTGQLFWIGYCGPMEKYPVHSPEELQKFYTGTLAQVPGEFLNQHFVRFVFTVDPSLMGADGKLLNPRVTRLAGEQDKVFARYGIKPAGEVPVRLIRGGDNAKADLNFEDGAWVSAVGLKSGCSPSLLNFFEERVRSAEAGRVQ